MRINFYPTNLINSNNQRTAQNSPTFKSYDYFTPIKNIKHLTCACCGKPMILVDDFVKALGSVAKSLKFNIENGGLAIVESMYPKVWAVLQKFAEKFPQLSLDQIIESDLARKTEFKLAAVDSVETTDAGPNTKARIYEDRDIDKIFLDTLDRARSFMEPAPKVIEALLPFKSYIIDDTKKDVFQQLEIYARKYPEKTLAEIIKTPEIYKFHATKNLLQRTSTREKLDYHFENIRMMVEKQNPDAVEKMDELKEESLEMFIKEKDDAARLHKIREMYISALEEFGCENLKDAVMNELEQVPLTFLTVDSFFTSAYARNYNDSVIISSIFNPYTRSVDHVDNIFGGGSDVVANKSVMHRSCNTKKGHRTLPEFLKYHPEMIANAAKQVQMVAEEITAGNVPDNVRYYPILIRERYKAASEGAIDFNLSEYSRTELRKTADKIEKNYEKIGNLKKIRTSLLQQLKDPRANKEEIEKQLEVVDEQLEKVKKEHQLDKSFRYLAETYLRTEGNGQ